MPPWGKCLVRAIRISPMSARSMAFNTPVILKGSLSRHCIALLRNLPSVTANESLFRNLGLPDTKRELPTEVVLTEEDYNFYTRELKDFAEKNSKYTLSDLYLKYTTIYNWDKLSNKCQREQRDCNDVAMELIGSFLLVLKRMGLIERVQFVIHPETAVQPILITYPEPFNAENDKKFVYNGLFNSNVRSVHTTQKYGIYEKQEEKDIKPGTLLVSSNHTMVVKNVKFRSGKLISVDVIYSMGIGLLPLTQKTYTKDSSYLEGFTPYHPNLDLITSPELVKAREYTSLAKAFK